MKCFLLIPVLFTMVSCSQSGASSTTVLPDKKAIVAHITDVMDKQADDWNSGNIDGFMAPYWNSDSLVFIGSRGLTKGYQTTLNNYKKSYPDPAAMGQLTFTYHQIEVLSDSAAYVIGAWALDREELNDLSGSFTLLWKQTEAGWRITADHSS